MDMKKRIASVILALLVSIAAFPAGALAAEEVFTEEASLISYVFPPDWGDVNYEDYGLEGLDDYGSNTFMVGRGNPLIF